MECFLDGAVFHNNPVRIANYESKLLWPDADERPPDILLPIGTGQHSADTDDFANTPRRDRRRLETRKKMYQPKPASRAKHSMRIFGAFEFESWLKIFKKRMESALDAELTWKDFRNDVIQPASYAVADRYIRLNPRTMNRIPKLDDKSQIDRLLEDIENDLRKHGQQTKIRDIAQRLVASSFYFDKCLPERSTEDHIIVRGKFISATNAFG